MIHQDQAIRDSSELILNHYIHDIQLYNIILSIIVQDTTD